MAPVKGLKAESILNPSKLLLRWTVRLMDNTFCDATASEKCLSSEWVQNQLVKAKPIRRRGQSFLLSFPFSSLVPTSSVSADTGSGSWWLWICLPLEWTSRPFPSVTGSDHTAAMTSHRRYIIYLSITRSDCSAAPLTSLLSPRCRSPFAPH